MTKKYLTIPAVVAGALGLTAVAQAAEPTTAELQKQIAELKAQMEQGDKNAAVARDVDATVESVLRDANDRSKLLAVEGITGGHNGDNFVLQSADGNYKLMPKFQFQVRHVTNYIVDGVKNGDGEVQDGFEIRRMKMEFAGNAITPDLKYNFRWGSERDGGGLALENAYIQYKFADDLAFRIGQYKDAVHHEEIVNSGKQLAVDRSLLNEVMGGGITDYVQGVALLWDNNENLRAEVGYNDGANSDNTNFQNGSGVALLGTSSTDFGITGRVEWAASGGFKGYDQFTSWGRKEDALVLGAGVNWTQAGSTDIYLHTADVQWNAGPLAVYGALVGQYLDTEIDESYNWGVLGQVGYMLNEQWEVFGRFDYTKFDGDIVSFINDDYWELTGGVNYYLKGHNAKVTLDLTYLPNGSPTDLDGIGVLAADNEDQFVIRGQFQLLL